MTYLYVMAWGKYVGRTQQEIEERLERARKENAPELALFPRQDRVWATIDELHSKDDRNAVQNIVDEIK